MPPMNPVFEFVLTVIVGAWIAIAKAIHAVTVAFAWMRGGKSK